MLALPAILSSSAVLQAGGPVPVWGWAAPRARVTVKLAGREAVATAGKDGRWLARLGPLEPGPVGDLIVTDGKATVVSRDLLAGEVWLCSGQSNMGMSVDASRDAEAERRGAEFPAIRLFQQENLLSERPLADTGAKWKACSPATVGGFSAVGYFFGREVHRTLGVPVGLINASWGGSCIETWMDAASLGTEPKAREFLGRWKDRMREHPEEVAGEWVLEFDDVRFIPRGGGAPVPLAGVDRAPAEARWGGVWGGSGATIRLARPAAASAKILVTMRPAASAVATRRLAADKASVDLSGFEAVRLRVRGEGRFRLRLPQAGLQPWEAHTSAPLALTKRWGEVTVALDTLKQPDWAPHKPLNAAAVEKLEFVADSGLGPNDMPEGLFNGMIHPLLPFAIRGAVWYQGESNAWAAERYRTIFPALITGWRRAWGQGPFPFYFVQLANWMKASDVAEDSEWAELREAQALTLSLTNTGQAVAIDVGEADDIHPKDKQTVGRRLALNALAGTYGRPVEASGPVYGGMRKDGAAIRLTFTHTTGGLAARSGAVTGFSVAGADRTFVKATATIGGDAVTVRAAGVADPVAVRYGWANNPVCNLVNGAGLPASPFRTDTWPGKTAGR